MERLPGPRRATRHPRGQAGIWDSAPGQWTIFGEGLHAPLGILEESEGSLLVMQRPDLTRLRDEDGDGEADVYEMLWDGFAMTGNYHDFAFGPVCGESGKVYVGLNLASNFRGCVVCWAQAFVVGVGRASGADQADGQVPLDLVEVRAVSRGFAVRFSHPLAEGPKQADAWRIRRNTFEYRAAYGSPEPNLEYLSVEAAEVAADGLSARIRVRRTSGRISCTTLT